MSKKYYQIRKTIIEKNISVILNDSMGAVLELKNFDEASQLCQIMNSNSDSNCKYEICITKEQLC